MTNRYTANWNSVRPMSMQLRTDFRTVDINFNNYVRRCIVSNKILNLIFTGLCRWHPLMLARFRNTFHPLFVHILAIDSRIFRGRSFTVASVRHFPFTIHFCTMAQPTGLAHSFSQSLFWFVFHVFITYLRCTWKSLSSYCYCIGWTVVMPVCAVAATSNG